MIEFAHVTAMYVSRKAVLNDLCLQIPPGSRLGVVGRNGVGKSTLFHLLLGWQKPVRGQIHGLSTYRRPMLCNQDYRQSLFPWWTVAQNLSYPLQLSGLAPAVIAQRITQFLQQWGIELPLAAYPWQLSGGQQQLTNLCRALLFAPDLLLLDEPFAALDVHHTALALDMLGSYAQAHAPTLLLISHQVDEILTLCDRVIVLGGTPVVVMADTMIPGVWPRRLVEATDAVARRQLKQRLMAALSSFSLPQDGGTDERG